MATTTVSLAARNLLRHRRRTLLTVLALVLGIGLMVLGRAWTKAMERAVVVPAKDATLGHLQVYARDAAADEGGTLSFVMPQNNYRMLREPRALVGRILAAEPRLAAGLSRLMVGALLSSGEKSLEGVLIGIDPAARPAVYPALSLRGGRHVAPGERGVLLNRGVAKRLGVPVGGEIVALGTASDGRLTGVRLPVRGIWMVKGLEAYEWSSCFADLASVQELVDVGDAAAVLVLRQKDVEAPPAPIKASLDAFFRREGIAAEVHTWEEMGGPFIGGVILTRFVASITDVLMAIIVAAGVLNTALMAVFERTREIGTLRAFGTRRPRVGALFLAEAALLGGLGALGGALFGLGLVKAFGRWGIPAFSEAQRYSYGGDFLYPVVAWPDLVTVPGLMWLVCIVAGAGPALLAARLRPVDALRHV
ncbi:MAG TPA: FtsX-like permease family protein [Vicinamibacteria bacterium]|nr:FtsX-like permease family protein [Vicinamibacteria bacterium]